MGAVERQPGPESPNCIASEGGIASGLPVTGRFRGSLPQNGIVMPAAGARARKPHGRDIETMCGPPGAGWRRQRIASDRLGVSRPYGPDSDSLERR